ncbi:Heparinase II/III family protein [Rhodomicrobium vannielii ATCC 17100]|uniref:Heparinase II/III family protein n=1 Tax=Rhodomicrobium vannielii (strain ATCC 17100 / DSM 162 / LMG 4299 / NCIMB 10020 / ATH 3.1.1) TaxID=648757 RepID=E3I4E7_RHOVT|nr:heparinase II/III family protein [Rhodomicrobium vannielii]ADP70462.1 Heparinase II/III family protein [Rhodomicrobium vannielii ATCC 17100]
MMPPQISDQARLAALAVNRAGRSALRLALKSPFSRWMSGIPAAYHLLILPHDLRTGDPSFAVELYDGYIGLAGATAPVGSESPFLVMPPTVPWQKELYGFGWLRHLHAAEDQIAREKARKLTLDWIAFASSAPPLGRDRDITARRVIALLSHAAFLLDGAEPDFYDAVMRMLSRDLHDLTVVYGDGSGVPKLRALTAILLAGLCIAEHETYLTSYLPTFSAELDRQILEDGGHVSRDPGELIELLLELLPLKQCFVARQLEPPEKLYSALKRMQAMVRFLRLGDGSLARFNGMGPTFLDQVSAVLAYDDLGATFPDLHAPNSGYARLAAGEVVIIADAGAPPPLHLSARAHAGCGAFEMSVGTEPLIANCGAPQDETGDWYVVSRSTAAHSTLSIDDLSSSRLIKAQESFVAGRELFWLSGPRSVHHEIIENDASIGVRIGHDGYRERFGMNHRRQIALHKSGNEFAGHDQLMPANQTGIEANAHFAIRFHLHPRVAAQLSRNTNAVTLTLPSGATWRMVAEGADLDIEESIFFADPICLRRSLQIVLKGPCSAATSVHWKFEKVAQQQKPVIQGAYPRRLV